MILFMLGWFFFHITWDAIYVYPKLSSKSLIPVVIRTCTFTSTCLSTLILSHRGTLSEFCSKISLVDDILLGRKASSSYIKIRVMIIIQILLVFVYSCIMTLFDTNGLNINLISVVKYCGWAVGRTISMFMIVHFLVFVWILKNRFCKLNAQLSSLVDRRFEEQHLVPLFSTLNSMNKADLAGEFNFISGPEIVGRKGPLLFSLSKVRSHVLQYNSDKIRALRLAHGVLCESVQRINSDYGFQILSEVSYAFISFVMFSYVAVEAKNDPTLGDCGNGSSSCVRVLKDLFISCLCIIKVLTIAASCHAVSSEISATLKIVQKLLSPRHISADSLAELQLFSQQLWNTDPRFTALGFFELNLNLLCSVLGTATTYIVVLLQLK
ncbi:hypothetical protein B7P43_G04082 [Cryptotermes secundus]|uniref:Gustatory receptor n=2 Tax=Cryptotermes secundus TaxID=105785 RepID=A0A2J7QS50_9NEOP|nr:hypothetical protein B7P43_G04082 [Cryptotermes secundus]